MTLEDKFTGCIVGAAVGDALGMPTEGIAFKDLDFYFNGKVTDYKRAIPSHPCRHLEPGQYTDDTQQIIVLSNSLIKNHGFNFADFAKDFGDWAYKCANEIGYDRFSGTSSIGAGLKIHGGGDIEKSGIYSDSCGAAMRISPLGLVYYDDKEKLKKYSFDAARITHLGKIAIDSAAIISGIVARIIDGKTPMDAVLNSLSLEMDSNLADKVYLCAANANKDSLDVSREIGKSSNASETVPMAIHCFLHSSEDFNETVINAANLVPGDTDSIACIAGALSGAYNGFSKIPERFRVVEDMKKLSKMGQMLYKLSKNSKY